jgi:hypothetical protein
MKKKCPKENHCETDRKCPPWCITVPDRSSKKVVPPPSLAEKVREPRPVAILFDHYTPGFALMSHLAQHRRELLVRLWNELVPRLFFAFRSSSADKIPFSLQPFYPTRGFKGIFCVEASVGEPIKEQIACELPICFIVLNRTNGR